MKGYDNINCTTDKYILNRSTQRVITILFDQAFIFSGNIWETYSIIQRNELR